MLACACACLSLSAPSAASFETPFSVGGKREEEREQFRHPAVPQLNKTARVCLPSPSADRSFLKIPPKNAKWPPPSFTSFCRPHGRDDSDAETRRMTFRRKRERQIEQFSKAQSSRLIAVFDFAASDGCLEVALLGGRVAWNVLGCSCVVQGATRWIDVSGVCSASSLGPHTSRATVSVQEC